MFLGPVSVPTLEDEILGLSTAHLDYPGVSSRSPLCSVPLPGWHLHLRFQHNRSQIELQVSPPLTQVCFCNPCARKGLAAFQRPSSFSRDCASCLGTWFSVKAPLSQPTVILPLCYASGGAHDLIPVLASVRVPWSCIQQAVLVRDHEGGQTCTGEK